MKLKSILGLTFSLCLSLFSAKGFSADILVASYGFTASNCSWSQWAYVGGGSGVSVEQRSLSCDGTLATTETKTTVPVSYGGSNGPTCSFNPTTAYTASGSCIQFSVYKKVTPVIVATQSSVECTWVPNPQFPGYSGYGYTSNYYRLSCNADFVASKSIEKYQNYPSSCRISAESGYTIKAGSTCDFYTIYKN